MLYVSKPEHATTDREAHTGIGFTTIIGKGEWPVMVALPCFFSSFCDCYKYANLKGTIIFRYNLLLFPIMHF